MSRWGGAGPLLFWRPRAVPPTLAFVFCSGPLSLGWPSTSTEALDRLTARATVAGALFCRTLRCATQLLPNRPREEAPLHCLHCGDALALDADPRSLYCTPACRHRAFRARRRAEARRRQAALSEALQAIESGAPRAHLVDVLTAALSA